MADQEKISQDQIEELLRQAQAAAGISPAPVASSTPSAPATSTLGAAMKVNAAPSSGSMAATMAPPASSAGGTATRGGNASVGDDIHFLLQQAQQAIASVDDPIDSSMAGISSFSFRDFGGAPASNEKASLELLQDVDLDLRIELGRTEMLLEDILKLKRGSVVSLDKLAGDPVDIYVNGRLIARGEVLVLNDNFCVRVAELLTGDDAA